MKVAKTKNLSSNATSMNLILLSLVTLAVSCRNYKGSNVILTPKPAEKEYAGEKEEGTDDLAEADGSVATGQLELEVPTESSDLSTFSLPVRSNPNVTFYAWKLSSDDSCDRTRDGYKIEGIKNPLPIDLGSLQKADLTLCVIAFDGKTKKWQSTKTPDVFSWKKVPFTRKMTAYYTFTTCDTDGSQLHSVTKISIDGSSGRSDWTVDPAFWGCADNYDPFGGTDIITVKTSTPTEMSGFYSDEGSQFGGWFKFIWLDKERTRFKGTFGIGDIGENPTGEWTTELPQRSQVPKSSKPY